MPRVVRGALVQATWTGDKESMIQKHEAARPRGRQAGRPVHALPGALLRALLLPGAGPQVLQLHRAHPGRARPRSACRTWPRRPAWSWSCPMYEEDEQASGIYYNTAAVIDADGTYLGKYRKTHIPHVKGFWEKFYFRPGNLGLPGLRDRRRQGRRLHLLRPPLPRGRARPGPQRRRDRVHPVGHRRAASREYLWRIEQVSHAVANGYFVGTINRVGIETGSATTTSTARATSATRAASSSARSATPTRRS